MHAQNSPEDEPVVARAIAGIDAAITARHHVALREVLADGSERLSRFTADPTLAGLASLARRLAAAGAPVTAVVEPTSMTWLALALAVEGAGGQLRMLGARDSARLRGAIMGKNKSDVIDAEVLSRVLDVLDAPVLALHSPAQLALRRAVVRRAGAVVDANRHSRRLLSLARWAFPDLWSAFAGSEPTALAVLARWPHLRALANARTVTVTAVVAEHTRGVPDAPARAAAVRAAARGWADFWDGHLDLDALAIDVTEHLADLAQARERVDRFGATARQWWEHLYGEDPLVLSLPGIGPATGPTVRAYYGDGSAFHSAKEAANYARITPSNWSSGTTRQPRRAITKEGPAPLRLALYQSASVARTLDPQLAAFYHRLMTERGHCHTQATIAVARKLAERTWTTLATSSPYQLRDTDETPRHRPRSQGDHRRPLHRHPRAARPRPLPHRRSETSPPDPIAAPRREGRETGATRPPRQPRVQAALDPPPDQPDAKPPTGDRAPDHAPSKGDLFAVRRESGVVA